MTEALSVFFWRNLECELCGAPYPHVVSVGEVLCEYDNRVESRRNVELFEVPRPELPYLILEPRFPEGRGVHIISLAKRKIVKLGRGHENDVRVHDISVSRLHANIRYVSSQKDTGAFLLEDLRSKFGTLVEVKNPLRLDIGVNISVQIGRNLLIICAKKTRNPLLGCFKKVQPVDDIVAVAYPNPLAIPVIESPMMATSSDGGNMSNTSLVREANQVSADRELCQSMVSPVSPYASENLLLVS